MGVSRARVRQSLNLLKLPAKITTQLETLKEPRLLAFLTERRLRPVTRLTNPGKQRQAFRRLLKRAEARRLGKGASAEN